MFKVKNKVWQLVAIFIVLGIFTMALPSALLAEKPITIHIDGKIIVSDVAPVIVKDRTMVPVRVISEELGREVLWQPVERRVLVNTPGSRTLVPGILPSRGGGVAIFIEGRQIQAQSEPQPFILNDRTMVPLRIIAEGLGMQVDWDNENRRVIINTPPVVDEAPVVDEPVKDNNPVADKPIEDTPVVDKDIVSKDPHANIDYELSIMGEAKMGREQLLAVMQKNNPAAPQELVDLYLQIGREYGVRGDVAFCQAAKETGWWKFGGLVEPYQHNYCGLGATGSAATGEEDLLGANPARVRYEEGVHGAIFDTPATGVEAHIQHLYAYACKKALPVGKDLVDPRFIKPTRGIAPRWIDLGGRWACPGFDRVKYENDFQKAFDNCDTYGHSILSDYYQKVLEIGNK